MKTIPHFVCSVIPQHMLEWVAGHRLVEASDNARATLEHMHELATGRAETLIDLRPEPAAEEPSDDRQRVYDAGQQYRLPGRLVMPAEDFRGDDVHVTEAWDGCGATDEFYERVLGRRSIDGHGMRLDSTVHYGMGFGNAWWNGRQMVFGDGDGLVFDRFTKSVDVIAHELTHGVTQHIAALGYTGQTGALNEHISDVFGSMVKQYLLGQTAGEADWLIGAELFGPAVSGSAIRSLALPGSAYDDPILGTDPQPSHMRDYVRTTLDNGGVHINSGILNHGFYLAAMTIGGYSWEVLGRIWYAALHRLKPNSDFADFVRVTIDIAGELFGRGGKVQRAIIEAWVDVGLLYRPPVSRSRRRGDVRGNLRVPGGAPRRRTKSRRRKAMPRWATY